jgi:hypothetical protein
VILIVVIINLAVCPHRRRRSKNATSAAAVGTIPSTEHDKMVGSPEEKGPLSPEAAATHYQEHELSGEPPTNDYELDESQRRSGYELGTEQRRAPEMQGSMYSSHDQHAGQPQWAQGNPYETPGGLDFETPLSQNFTIGCRVIGVAGLV